ncbi:hypothetical protein Tco_1419064 [Tanacetum coccineum]
MEENCILGFSESTHNAVGKQSNGYCRGENMLRGIELPFDLNMHALENYSIFNFSSDDHDNGAEADLNNLDTKTKSLVRIYIALLAIYSGSSQSLATRERCISLVD